MSQVELRNISSRIPVIPLVPIPISTAASPTTEEDAAMENEEPPVFANGSIDVAQLAAEIAKRLPGATTAVGRPKKGSKKASAAAPVLHQQEWKASFFVTHLRSH